MAAGKPAVSGKIIPAGNRKNNCGIILLNHITLYKSVLYHYKTIKDGNAGIIPIRKNVIPGTKVTKNLKQCD